VKERCGCETPEAAGHGTPGDLGAPLRAVLCAVRPLVVSAPENADSYPAVSWIWSEFGWEAPGLAVGDRLLRLGNADLRGVGPLGFVARSYEEVSSSPLPISLSFLRAGERREALLGPLPTAVSWQFLPLTLGFGVTAVLVLLRLPGSRFARAFFLASIVYSFTWIPFSGEPRALTYAQMAVWSASLLVVLPLGLHLLLLFPDEGAPPSARLPAWPWLFAVFGPIVTSMMFGVPLPPVIGHHAYSVVSLADGTAMLLLLTRSSAVLVLSAAARSSGPSMVSTSAPYL
jgi:hypothetical protein